MPQAAPADFGAMLRRAREARGVSLRDIAEATKISMPALEALERNDVSHLPGGLFARSFVRSYARETGLDPEEAVRAFVAAFPDQDPAAAEMAGKAAPRSEVTIRGESGAIRAVGRVLSVVVPVAVIIAYLAWSGRLASWSRPAPQAAPAASEAPAPAQPAPVPPTPAPPAPAPKVDRDAAVPLPLAGPVPQAAGEPPAAAPPPAPAAAEPAPAVGEAPLPEGTLRLTLRAQGRCWVSLRSDGVRVFAGTLLADEERSVDVRGRISLTVGDAGVFSYSINGQPARQIGVAGEVATVIITAQNYRKLLQSP